MTTRRNRMRRHLATTTLALTITAGLGTAIVLTSAGATSASTVAQTTATLDTALADQTAPTGDRARLRADLKKARDLKGDERRAAVQKIRADAASGVYGDRVEKRADRRADRRSAIRELLPQELQDDLATLEAAPAGERKALRDDIRRQALAGDYGAQVEAAAKKLQDRWAD